MPQMLVCLFIVAVCGPFFYIRGKMSGKKLQMWEELKLIELNIHNIDQRGQGDDLLLLPYLSGRFYALREQLNEPLFTALPEQLPEPPDDQYLSKIHIYKDIPWKKPAESRREWVEAAEKLKSQNKTD